MAGWVFANRVFNPRMGQPAALQGVGPVASASTFGGTTFRAVGKSNVRPSYKSGFARSASASAYTGLRAGMAGAWCPALGNTGTSTLPDSHSIYDATLVDAAASNWSMSQYGPVLETTQNITLSHLFPGVLPVSAWNSVSFSILMKPNSPQLAGRFISILHSGGDDIRLHYNSPNVIFTMDDGSTSGEITTALGTGWQHIVGTHDGTTQRLYIDGVEIAANSKSYDYAGTNGSLVIGRSSTTDNFWGSMFFASAYVWSRAITPQEVRTLYRDPLAPFRLRGFVPINTTPTFDSFCLDNSELYYPGSTESELYSPGAAESQIGC